jgi:hypothetical protein
MVTVVHFGTGLRVLPPALPYVVVIIKATGSISIKIIFSEISSSLNSQVPILFL